MFTLPLLLLMVPISSSSGFSRSEPWGRSLSVLSRAGSRRSSTTKSCCARSDAALPLRRVFRYCAARSLSPLREALRKPRTAPLGVVRPRASWGTSGLDGAGADERVPSCPAAGKENNKTRHNAHAPVRARLTRSLIVEKEIRGRSAGSAFILRPWYSDLL